MNTNLVARAGVGALGLVNFPIGVWAVTAPRHWYENYPGFGRHWVAAQGGTFDAHLVADTGAGFLAVGAVLLVAYTRWNRAAAQIALVALIAHAAPHFVHHITHQPAQELAFIDQLVGIWGIAFQAVAAAGILLLMARDTASERIPGSTRHRSGLRA